MMFKAKTTCEAKVVNLELNSGKKQLKYGMKNDVLKCSLAVDAGIFQVVRGPHLRGTARSSKPANLAIVVTEA